MKKIMKKCLATLFFRRDEEPVSIECAKNVLNGKGYTVLSRGESELNKMKITSSVLKSYVGGRTFFTWSMKRRVLEVAAIILSEYEYTQASADCYDVANKLREISEREYKERHGKESKRNQA